MVADLEDSLEEESLDAALLPQDTDRLRLDLPRADDLADLVFLANNRRIATMLAHLPHPFTLADGRAYIANASRHTANRAKFAVRMRSTGRIIGAVGYSVLDEGGPRPPWLLDRRALLGPRVRHRSRPGDGRPCLLHHPPARAGGCGPGHKPGFAAGCWSSAGSSSRTRA